MQASHFKQMKQQYFSDDVFTVTDFLSPDECQRVIDIGETSGFRPAPVKASTGTEEIPDWRNNTRVVIDDEPLAIHLWETAGSYAPNNIDNWTPSGINKRFRLYRYEDNQQFDWHTDGFYKQDDDTRSFLTFMVYLNSGFVGGETSFSDQKSQFGFEDFSIVPKLGLALFFAHYIPHKGQLVTDGRKYVLRSDVMYLSLIHI